MAEYIDKDDLKFLEIPIAPVLQGEQVHYEQGFLKEWLESVPTANVIERSKIDKAIEEIEGEYSTCNQDWIDGLNRALEILKRNLGE